MKYLIIHSADLIEFNKSRDPSNPFDTEVRHDTILKTDKYGEVQIKESLYVYRGEAVILDEPDDKELRRSL